MTPRTLRLNSAVTPRESLYAATRRARVLDEVGAQQERFAVPEHPRQVAEEHRPFRRVRLPTCRRGRRIAAAVRGQLRGGVRSRPRPGGRPGPGTPRRSGSRRSQERLARRRTGRTPQGPRQRVEQEPGLLRRCPRPARPACPRRSARRSPARARRGSPARGAWGSTPAAG